jgi:hypothetical protein
MSVRDRRAGSPGWFALVALAAATLTLSGCGASPAPVGMSDGGDELPAADGDALPAPGDADTGEDSGSVTLTITSGAHAGSYSGSGSLKCNYEGFIPGSWWVTFASEDEEEDPGEVTLANLWVADSAHVDDEESPYPGDSFIADLWLGNPFLDGAKFNGSDEAGGELRVVSAAGNDVSFAGTTPEGDAFTFDAMCSRITN